MTVRALPAENGWQLVHPRCADQRADDMAEVDEMLAVGESELAREELRFLLQDCPDFLAAHQKLGEIAFEEHDLPLARGHFGYVFDLVRKSLPPQAKHGPLRYALVENQPVHESGKGLAWCLRQLERHDLARDVVRQLLTWDDSDPLNVRSWLEA